MNSRLDAINKNNWVFVLAWLAPVSAGFLLPPFVFHWPYRYTEPYVAGAPWLLLVIACSVIVRRASSAKVIKAAREARQGAGIATLVTLLFYFFPSVALTKCYGIYWDYHIPSLNAVINRWANGSC